MAVRTKRLALGALFTALGILLPLAFHLTGIPAAGQVFLPMHIPVLLCGFDPRPGLQRRLRAVCPVAGFLLMNMPAASRVLFMTVELCAYGLSAGLLYRKCGLDRLRLGVYPALLGAMLSGRLLYALALTAAATLFGMESVSAYLAVQATITGLAGIAVQAVVLPPLVKLFERSAFARELGLRAGKPRCCARPRACCKARTARWPSVSRAADASPPTAGRAPLLECIDRYGALRARRWPTA